jgi:hypothetical protein
MHSIALAAGVLAAALVVGGASARAADLDYDQGPRDRLSSAYEDPRYRDLYGPEPGPHPVKPPHYAYDPVPPRVPPAYVYREPDRDRGRYRPSPEERHADPRDYRPEYRYRDEPRRYGETCVPRDEIRRRLVDGGWREFRDLELRGDLASVHARRPSGDLYELRIDRCTGEVADTRLLDRADPGPYASQDRRDRRPYY